MHVRVSILFLPFMKTAEHLTQPAYLVLFAPLWCADRAVEEEALRSISKLKYY